MSHKHCIIHLLIFCQKKKNFTHQALRLVSSGLVQRGAALFALVVPLAVRLPNEAEGALHSVEASNKHFRLLPKNSSLKKKRDIQPNPTNNWFISLSLYGQVLYHGWQVAHTLLRTGHLWHNVHGNVIGRLEVGGSWLFSKRSIDGCLADIK